MKTLTLVRHGKAEVSSSKASDEQRSLTKRGVKDARLVAEYLRQVNNPVNLVITSPARRARETVDAMVPALDTEIPIVVEEAIYEASAQNLANVLRRLPESAVHVALVGHNPGLAELVSGLCAGSYNRLNLNMRPAMIAHIKLEIFHWPQVRWGSGQLLQLISPNLVARPKQKKKKKK